ncbi:MAG: hypothetical protein ACTHJW_07455 [Streptosporangiaceae bacterium]
MTTIAAAAADPQSALPGRENLARATLRQHRIAIAGMLAAFAAVAVPLVVTGIQTHLAYARYLQHHCLTARLPLCHPVLLNQMGADSWVLSKVTGIAVLPVLTGVFLGAPLVARDFETGAFRFSLTQGLSIRRQVAVKLLVLGALVAAAAAVLGTLSMWDMAPHHHIAPGNDTGLSYWWPVYFNITALTLPAWALLDFSLGVLAGVAVRRVVPAMAVTLAAAAVVAVAGSGYATWGPEGLYSTILQVNPVAARDAGAPFGHLMWNTTWPAPVTARLSQVPGPPGSFWVAYWLEGPKGRLTPARAGALLNQVPPDVQARYAASKEWMARRHVTAWFSYQPASRYWLFQSVLAAILLAFTAAAGFTAVRLAGRRR